MKIVFLDAATMGDTSFSPIENLGEFICYDYSTPEEAIERVKDYFLGPQNHCGW